MSIPTITALPSSPSISDPTNFETEADALLGALPTLVTELNAFGPAILASYTADNYNATSTTSLAIGTGSKAFTIQTGKIFQVGQYVIAASAADPTNFMYGQITAHNATTGALTISVAASGVGGSGTKTDWVISLSGPRVSTSAWTQIGATVNLTSGTEVDFTGIKTSAADYTDIYLLILGASSSSTSDYTLSYSPDASSWATAAQVTSLGASSTVYGGAIFSNFKKDGGLLDGSLANVASSPANGGDGSVGIWRSTGGIDALRIAVSAGPLDAGTAQLFARG